MNKSKVTGSLFIIILFLFQSLGLYAVNETHPRLLLTPKGVSEIKKSSGKYPAFDQSVEEICQQAKRAIKLGVVVPIPKDGGGGYTHEKHKDNYYAMYNSGIMYQLTGDKTYANFVIAMLKEYAKIYPKLPLHPYHGSSTPGKLFWQTLNDYVWLVHVACAYDCIYPVLNKEDRVFIENNLFLPMADFIMNGNPANTKTFNKMHNHATWATAAVGMIGYAMNNQELVNKALYGSDLSRKGGFIKQLYELFSPDGYYAEGGYYLRYAIWPFVTFAQVINNCDPTLKIFEIRDHILEKAFLALVNQAYNGHIFSLNDALPKDYHTQEIVCASNIIFGADPSNNEVLEIIALQNKFIISDAGIKAAKALAERTIPKLTFKSQLYRDGALGTKGGLAILRSGSDDTQNCLTFKATTHGLSHGHFDKLSVSWYDNGNNLLEDYGAVRFLNVVTKDGGRYTKENTTWAKQTISHNTLTVDETSHYNGDQKISEKYSPYIRFYDDKNSEIQIVSAVDSNAVPGVIMTRTLAMIQNKGIQNPYIIDVFNAESTKAHKYDLPFYYKGQMTYTNFKIEPQTQQLLPLGNKNGYQHLWVEGISKTQEPMHIFTWVNANRFYTLSTLGNSHDQLILGRIGANDPNFNLRNDPTYIIRRDNVASTTFITIAEPHGLYDLEKEVTEGYESSLETLEKVQDDQKYCVVRVKFKGQSNYLLILPKDVITTSHQLKINEKLYKWNGDYFWATELK